MKPSLLAAAVMLVAVCGQLVWAGDQEKAALAAACSDFSQQLHLKVSHGKDSVVLSPISIHSGLSMPLLGARNETAEEMEQVLNYSSVSSSEGHDAYRELFEEYKSVVDIKLKIVNAMFVNSEKSVKQEFREEVESKYLAKVEQVNVSDPDAERKINEYVKEETDGLIEEILSEGSIDERTSVILVNTLTLNATWQEAFSEDKTRKRDFKRKNGETVKVDMMSCTRRVLFKRDTPTDTDIIHLPLKNPRFAFFIILPRTIDGIDKLEEILAEPGKLNDLVDGLSPSFVEVNFPRFTVESSLDLEESLREMGMEKALTPGVADFSGISESEQLYISKVHHKACFAVDEKGTVGSAATLVEVGTKSARPQKPQHKFLADHSFLFLVRDEESKHILFEGTFQGDSS